MLEECGRRWRARRGTPAASFDRLSLGAIAGAPTLPGAVRHAPQEQSGTPVNTHVHQQPLEALTVGRHTGSTSGFSIARLAG